MSAYSEHEKAVPVEFADSTETATDRALAKSQVLLEHIAAGALAVAIVGLPLIADWLATGLIGPELIP